jgi:hypothetical protein
MAFSNRFLLSSPKAGLDRRALISHVFFFFPGTTRYRKKLGFHILPRTFAQSNIEKVDFLNRQLI